MERILLTGELDRSVFWHNALICAECTRGTLMLKTFLVYKDLVSKSQRYHRAMRHVYRVVNKKTRRYGFGVEHQIQASDINSIAYIVSNRTF